MVETRLPHNQKEGFLYGSIIAIISVIFMLFINIGSEFGTINRNIIIIILKLIPIFWVIALLLESLIIGRIASKLVEKFSEPSDSFNAKILFNILFCVLGMSIVLTIIGGMIGSGKISLVPFKTFFLHWPRNFCAAFWCEILLAQPIARFTMKKIHKKKKNKESEKNDEK